MPCGGIATSDRFKLSALRADNLGILRMLRLDRSGLSMLRRG
jgi:hypothetical protein